MPFDSDLVGDFGSAEGLVAMWVFKLAFFYGRVSDYMLLRLGGGRALRSFVSKIRLAIRRSIHPEQSYWFEKSTSRCPSSSSSSSSKFDQDADLQICMRVQDTHYHAKQVGFSIAYDEIQRRVFSDTVIILLN